MSSDDDWLLPSRNKSWDVLDDNWLSKDCASKDVPDGSIWTLPHFFKIEFLHSCLIRSNGSAFDAYLAFFDGLGSFKGNFILSGISMLDA